MNRILKLQASGACDMGKINVRRNKQLFSQNLVQQRCCTKLIIVRNGDDDDDDYDFGGGVDTW